MAMDSTTVMEIEVATTTVVEDITTTKHSGSYTTSYSSTNGVSASQNGSATASSSVKTTHDGVVLIAASNAALYPEVARVMLMTVASSGGLVSAPHDAWYPDVKRVMQKVTPAVSRLVSPKHAAWYPDVKRVMQKTAKLPQQQAKVTKPVVEPKETALEVTVEEVTVDVETVTQTEGKETQQNAVATVVEIKEETLEVAVEVEQVIQKASPVAGGLVSAPHDAWYPDVKRVMQKASPVTSRLASGPRDAWYPDVKRLMQKVTHHTTTKATTETKEKTLEVTVTVDISLGLSKPADKTTPPQKKKWGSFLPKVPAILLPRKDSSSAIAAASSSTHSSQTSEKKSNGSDHAHTHDHDDDEHTDEVRELSDAHQAEKPAPVPLASRLRGLSIEQNAFASSIVRKFSTLRSQSQSSNDSPRNSIDGVPPTEKRRSLTGALSLGGHNNHPVSPHGDVNAKARRGACVATKFGTGTVLDIRTDDGFYIVQLVPKSIAYLREDMIVREIKSVVGERVKTRWGLATVEQYYVEEDMYSIALDWRWDDDHVWRMKATTKKFEKIPRSMSIVQNTKNKIFEGYSTIRESASFGYANVAAKINTTASTYKAQAATRPSAMSTAVAPPQSHHLHSHGEDLGKALTPYGIGTVVEVRPDQFFVVKIKHGATAYLHADSVKLLHRRTHFSAGERVKTPYGTGEVARYRDEDEVYEIKLDLAMSLGSLPPTLYISDVHAETMLLPASANGTNTTRLSSIFTMTRNSVYSASATVKASASGGLNTLSNVKSKVSTMAAIKMTKVKFQKGERVITSFGSGFVSDCRPLERIYEVQLRRLKFRGYFHESALTAFPYERVTHFIVDGKTIPAPEMPKSMPEHKRRNIINTAIRQAREGR